MQPIASKIKRNYFTTVNRVSLYGIVLSTMRVSLQFRVYFSFILSNTGLHSVFYLPCTDGRNFLATAIRSVSNRGAFEAEEIDNEKKKRGKETHGAFVAGKDRSRN